MTMTFTQPFTVTTEAGEKKCQSSCEYKFSTGLNIVKISSDNFFDKQYEFNVGIFDKQEIAIELEPKARLEQYTGEIKAITNVFQISQDGLSIFNGQNVLDKPVAFLPESVKNAQIIERNNKILVVGDERIYFLDLDKNIIKKISLNLALASITDYKIAPDGKDFYFAAEDYLYHYDVATGTQNRLNIEAPLSLVEPVLNRKLVFLSDQTYNFVDAVIQPPEIKLLAEKTVMNNIIFGYFSAESKGYYLVNTFSDFDNLPFEIIANFTGSQILVLGLNKSYQILLF
jgi:hypothetical protein